jgi:DNA polymerase III alpha subunit
LLRDLEAAGEPPELAEAILTALPRLVPHLEQLPPWLARARALAALGDLAGEAPAALVVAMADLLPDRLQAIFAWARARGVAVLRPDVNASAVDSKVADCGVAGAGHGARGRMLVRLGLVHLPGLDRAAAEVVTRARGDRPFLGRDDLVRRLQARVPAATLRHLIGREAAVAGGGEGDAPLSGDGGAVARRDRVPAGGPDVRALPAARGGGRPTPLLLPALDTGRDAMQYDLFASARRSPRIFTAALSRFGILSLERAIRAPEGSRVRTVGVIRGLRGMVASGGRRLAAAWLEDGDGAADLLLLPSLLEASQDLPLGRPVVLDCRVAGRDGRIQLMVETAVPLELLSSVAQPALEIVLPRGFRRVRALKLRLLKSPGRSPLRVRARDAERAEAAAGLSRLAVTPDDALLADLRSLVGEDNVYLVGEVAGRAGAA